MNNDKVLKLTFNEDIITSNNPTITLNAFYPILGLQSDSFVFQYAPRTQAGQIQIWDPSSGTPSPHYTEAGRYTAELFAYYYNIDKPSYIRDVNQVLNVVYISIQPNQFTNIIWLQPLYTNIFGTVIPFEILDDYHFNIDEVVITQSAQSVCNLQRSRLKQSYSEALVIK